MSGDNLIVTRSQSNRRILHWVVVGAFFALLATGLILYTPTFSALAAGSWIRLIHRIAAVLLVGAPIIYALVNRGAARQWIKEAAIWNRKASATPYLNSWKRKYCSVCSFAQCANACPFGAMNSRQDGIIERVHQKCNNCRLCMENCQSNSYYGIQPKKDTQQLKTGPNGQKTLKSEIIP